MARDQHELLTAWHRRARPVVRRWASRGRPVDQRRLAETLRLLVLIEYGTPDAFSAANWGRSHHDPACPFSGRRTPLATVDPSPEAAWASR